MSACRTGANTLVSSGLPLEVVHPSAKQERAFSLTPSRLSAVSTEQLSPPRPGNAAALKARSFPEPGAFWMVKVLSI